MSKDILTFLTLALFCSFVPMTCIANNSTINIVALVASDTPIGKMAKKAIEIALAEINKGNELLMGSNITLYMYDTKCSKVDGLAAALQFLKREVVAVIGPQSSEVSNAVAYLGNLTNVPFISFASTDASLTNVNNPYFFRIAHTDVMQMEAITSLIQFYGWREIVMIHTNDGVGINGAAALNDVILQIGAQIIQTIVLAPDMNKSTVHHILTGLAQTHARIFVVHVPISIALMLFAVAKDLGMMSAGYAWIVTDAVMGTLRPSDLDIDVFQNLEGVIGLRRYYSQDSMQFRNFLSLWKNQSPSGTDNLNVYGLYAYDSMWLIANALNSYIKSGLSFSFTKYASSRPNGTTITMSDLGQLQVFAGGPLLRSHTLKTALNGTSGLIQINPNGDLIHSSFEIVNVVGAQLHVVGYWTKENQLCLSPPESGIKSSVTSNSLFSSLQIVWPGNTRESPPIWLPHNNGFPLRIAVPNREGFWQFVSWTTNSSNMTKFSGFCIEVFEAALKHLPYSVPHTFEIYGNNTTPIYDDLIEQVANKVYDGAVGDITITTKRASQVDFTQPYTQSGLVVAVTARDTHANNAWIFLQPFTPAMWLTSMAFLILTGFVVWIHEHKKNESFHGHARNQVGTIIWFSFSTLFFSQTEGTKTVLGRFVVIVWLFVVLIVTSSYTANLTSILTVQQLAPATVSIKTLQASNEPVGYRAGCYVREYLISLNIAEKRLKPLASEAAYAEALNLGPEKGGVAAIIDGDFNMKSFVSTECGFKLGVQEFTIDGWGFAFQKGSPLATDLSTAMLKMAENGELKTLQDRWLTSSSKCNAVGSQGTTSQTGLERLWGLFLISGLAYLVSILIWCAKPGMLPCSTPQRRQLQAPGTDRISLVRRLKMLRRIYKLRKAKSNGQVRHIPDVAVEDDDTNSATVHSLDIVDRRR